MNELALFAGAGGGILGGKRLGWNTICAVELDGYARSVLLSRQRDGKLPFFPIWDDVRTFDGTPWKGKVCVISGGFPCQDISCAGNRQGIEGEKSGLWKEYARIICEVRPCFVFVENSPDLAFRGLGRVLGDLATMGYDARWGVFSSADIGACHIRERMWILAYSKCIRPGRISQWKKVEQIKQKNEIEEAGGLSIIAGNYDGLADRLDRKRCVGNGQDPRVVELA
jgi:DNA (cytosine-5)-methyltransferase 1